MVAVAAGGIPRRQLGRVRAPPPRPRLPGVPPGPHAEGLPMSGANGFQVPRSLRRRVTRWHWGRQRRVGPPGLPNTEVPVACPTLAMIANVGFLLRVFHDRKLWAGKATGIDGIRWSDIGRSEAATI